MKVIVRTDRLHFDLQTLIYLTNLYFIYACFWQYFAISFCFYFTTKNVLVCFLFLPLSLYGEKPLVRRSQRQLSRYYIFVKAMHCECFQANPKLEIWSRLISSWRQNGALLRDRFRLRDSKARLSTIKSSRPTDRIQSACFLIQPIRLYALERPELSSLCTRKMPAGDTSRLSAPINQPWCCGGACNRFNTATEIRLIHRFARNFGV